MESFTESVLSLDELAEKLVTAKQIEEMAKNTRIEIENKLIKMLGVKEEGSRTFGADHFKVTTKGVINYTCNMEKYNHIRETIAPDLRPEKITFDKTQYNYLRNNEPEIFAIVAQCVTSKPGKSSVTVKPFEA